MTQTLDSAGRPLFFPPSLATNDAGVILPRPMSELAPLVDQVAPEQLFPFSAASSTARASASARRAGRR